MHIGMLRRLLACFVALAIALPSAGVGAVSLVADLAVSARQASADCDCPPGKSDCASQSKTCDCGLACVARIAATGPAIAMAMTVSLSAAPTDLAPIARAAPLSSALQAAPFRPPRSTIPD